MRENSRYQSRFSAAHEGPNSPEFRPQYPVIHAARHGTRLNAIFEGAVMTPRAISMDENPRGFGAAREQPEGLRPSGQQ